MDARRGPKEDCRDSSDKSLLEFPGRPAAVLLAASHLQVQNNRDPLRRQAITASGFTMTGADGQSVQNATTAQRYRSPAVSLGRFTERCKTSS